MQTQAQGVGQQGQASQAMSNGFNSRNLSAACWKPWHKEDDANLRREVFSRILQMVQKRGLEKNVLEIAKDVETALYLDAASKEEYADFQTLDVRLYSLMLRLRSSHKPVQQGVQPGSVFSRASAPACSNVGLNSSNITSNVTLGRENMGSSFSFNVGGTSLSTDLGGNKFPSVGGYGSMPGQCLTQGQGVSLGQYGLGGSGIAVPSQFGHTTTGATAGSCMIPTPGLNLRSLGQVSSKPVELDTSADIVMPSDQRSQYFDEAISFQRNGLPGKEAVSGGGGMLNSVKVAAKERGNFNGSSIYVKALGLEQALTHSHYPQHPRQQLLSNGVVAANVPAVCGDGAVAGSTFRTSTLATRFGAGNLSSLASEQPDSAEQQQILKLSESNHNRCSYDGVPSTKSSTFSLLSQQQVVNNQVVAEGNCVVDSGASALRSYAPPLDQFTRELSSRQNARHVHENQDNLPTRELCAGDQWHSQQSLQSNVHVNLQPSNSEQACQASSADTGQSEVVSNDDGLMPKQIKNAGNITSTQQVKRQQWLLIFLRHVSRCVDPGKCTVTHCAIGQESWKHLTACQVYPCAYPRCSSLKWLLRHHQKCRNLKCIVCGPVRHYFSQQAAASRAKLKRESNLLPEHSRKELASVEVDSPPVKRAKVEILNPDVLKEPQQPFKNGSASCQDKSSTTNGSTSPITFAVDIEKQGSHQVTENFLLKVESPTESSLSAGSHSQEDTKFANVDDLKIDSSITNIGIVTQEIHSVLQESEMPITTAAVANDVVPFKGSSDTSKPAKSKISGISFIESFSPEQIREHISSLRKWIGQSKCKAEKNQAVERQMLASACSACGVENLYFDPIPIFCTQCGCRIKRNYIYHSTGAGENSFNFCGPCYSAIRDDVLEADGFKVQKSMLVKKKNDEQRVEGWVECDKCKKWQHQICVLFNARINKERSEYACPDCCIAEMERSERVPLLANSVPGAKDLPKTILSDFLEERLALKLEEERIERSRVSGKTIEEVPTAEGLVVRVISSVDKKLEVKPKFLELFQQEDYPKDFLYKSKMVMLFQKIEGVEVCLFGMYVQEFGSECPQPNDRWVYLSYLDSVKYFRPDVKTSKGEALRTYVYHEILIAYLDYCKKRGFSSCYIWACPPLKGDDYILYCHPEIQKTPKTDKLREWYLNMISKAKKEKIVVANKNLYDYFFTTGNDCKAKVSAARLPYFDGDYWPGAAEDILQQLEQEKDGYYSQRRGKMNKIIAKRTTKTSAQTDLAGSQSKDFQLMTKLGQSIAAMKEDFIIVQMHHACSRCRLYIVSGARWICKRCCGNFQLCASCHEEHEKLQEEDRHPAGKKESHQLILEEVCDVPADTKDRDDVMESEFFDNRQAFLSLCQGNQYQHDTLRRAKHSSMMVLYHLHNPNAPAFITSCAICHSELEAGQGWRCKTCTDFDVCSACYSSGEVQRHPHKFMARATAADLSTANPDLRKQRMLQLRMMLEVLVHASKCRDPSCQFAKCRNMKELFRHGNSCTKRAMGGCSICKRMWFLLTTHARACKETVCSVPRCTDLRKHLKRTQLQQDSRRRAAVNEMIRQRAAEAAGAQ
ncbi:hypothetical protein L7F22_024091 [Adiantum nelumboides]|nr:hypothetical protein [Adiantum nelumboides]